MFKLLWMLSMQIMLYYIMLLLSINFSMYMYMNLYLFNINIILSYMFMWFMFFMLYMYYIMIYLLIKKYISNIKYKYMIIMFSLMLLFVMLVMVLDDFMCFIMCFESLFFPMCFMSLFFNFNNRFMFAIYYLIMFSSISSILCLMITVILLFYFNLMNINYFNDICFYDSLYLNMYMWMLLFIMFGIKYPMWPFHAWLPELHVEVNTELSIMLASMVLKMGFFGMFKYMYLALNNISMWFLGFIDMIMLMGIVMLSMQLLYLMDYKKMMAYWSVIHTGMGLVLLWHNDILYVSMMYLCNLGHMMSSGFMFIMMGYMYDNYGLRMFMMLMSFFGLNMWSSLFLLLFLFNIDFPFMLLMYMDLFVLYGLLTLSYLYIYLLMIMLLTMFISTLYMYLCLSFYTFVWLDKYLSLDMSINDCMMFMLIGMFTMLLFFTMYLFI